MEQLCLSLFCFAITAVLIAGIGHVLWLIGASMFAAIFGGSPGGEHHVCPGCAEDYPTTDERCPSCGLAPHGKAAIELRDLEATARTVQRMLEQGTLPAETCETIYAGIEARQAALLPQRRRTRLQDPHGATALLEEWFGQDLGEGLSIEQKKRALVMARTLSIASLRELSPRTLVGIARLQTAVGTLSRACQTYGVLLDCHLDASITGRAAIDAIRIAAELDNWETAAAFVRQIETAPRHLARYPALVDWMRTVRERTAPVLEPLPSRLVAEVAPGVAAIPLPLPEQVPESVATTETVAVEASAPVAEIRPRPSLGEWIGVFMEQRNILWGEVIGGTLIVGCSIALVISLWATLSEYPMVPFLIFAATTSALFGAGFYTLHHWKLESTSRGLLLIGTLLVPLNFLVLASIPRGESGPLTYLIELLAVGILGWFCHRGARILVEAPLGEGLPSALLVTFAVLISGATQLFAPRLLDDQPWSLCLISLVPVTAQLVALGWLLVRLAPIVEWQLGRVFALLIALASTAFAAGVTISYPFHAAADLSAALPSLAPALALFGVPVLGIGILIQQKLSARQTEDAGENRALWRTVGTGLALVGLLVMFAGFAASIHQPIARGITGSLNIAVLLGLACWLRTTMLHIPAQLYLATLVVFGVAHDLDLARAAPSAALRLMPVLMMQAIAAEVLMRVHRWRDALCYAFGGGGVTVIAALLIAPFTISHPGVTAVVAATIAATWLGANLRWRYAEITYASALVLAAAIFFTLRLASDAALPEQLLWTALAHATLCLAGSLAIRWQRAPDWLDRFFRVPLQNTSLAATAVAAAILIVEQSQLAFPWWVAAIACAWLAALWLIFSVLERWAPLFAGFQITLAITWVCSANAWLSVQGWDWREPYSHHVHILGLAVLCLCGEGVRRFARAYPRVNELLTPAFVPADRVITIALVVYQYALATLSIAGSVASEITTTPEVWRFFPAEWQKHAWPIWLGLSVLCLVLSLALWMRERLSNIPFIASAVLLLTTSIFIAGACFQEQRAVASALRWTLTLAYALASIVLWSRDRFRWQIPTVAIRVLMTLAAVGPVLIFSALVVVRRLMHLPIPGPAGGIFALIGSPTSLLVPLATISVVLAGHGIRERLARYLLSASSLANMTAVGAYFLILQRMQVDQAQPTATVHAFLLATGVAWLGSAMWTLPAAWLETEECRPLLDSPLLTFQEIASTLLFAIPLAPALGWLMFGQGEVGQRWTQAMGSPWSWPVLALMILGSSLACWKRAGRLPLSLIGALSLTGVGLAACSVEAHFGDHGFFALMLGSALFACVWAWAQLLIDPDHPPRWLACSDDLLESPVFTVVSSGVAILLGSTTLVNGMLAVWSAHAIILASVALALLAHQRKTEIWTSLASAGFVLASVILSLHLDPTNVLQVLQIGLAVLGSTSVVRLALHRWIAPDESTPAQLVFLPIQIGLGLAVVVGLLVVALASMVALPQLPNDAMHDWLLENASVAGWLALGTHVLAFIGWIACRKARWTIHAVAMSGLLMGVALGGTAEQVLGGAWTAYHTLTLVWTLLALSILALAWCGQAQGALGPQFWAAERRTWLAEQVRICFPESAARGWVTMCGLVVVILALRAAWQDPGAPFWSVANTLAVSILLGTLAVWARATGYIYASGLLVNVIALLIFSAWSSHRLNARGPLMAHDEWGNSFVLTQIVAFAIASIVWSAIERRLDRNNIDVSGSGLPFSQAAILAGTQLFVIVIGLGNALHLSGEPVRLGTLFPWITLTILVVATLGESWRPRFHRFTRYQLYTHGLLTIGLSLHALQLTRSHWLILAMVLLAGYVLVIVAVVRLAYASDRLRKRLHLSDEPVPGSRWFWLVQFTSIALVVALSMGITLTSETVPQRLTGVLAVTLVTAAAFLLVRIWPDVYSLDEPGFRSHSLLPNWVVLVLSVVVTFETYAAFIEPSSPAPWLQHVATAMGVSFMMAILYRFAISAWMADGKASSWTLPARRLSATLTMLALLLLFVLLGVELVTYDPALTVRRTPLRVDLVVFAGIAIASMIGFSLYSALTRELDTYGIEGGRRSTYIYIAELLGLFLLAHVRLNLPDLIPPMLGQFWCLSVMLLAFASLALSEFYERKDRPVLALPLKHSAMLLAFVPVVTFRLAPLSGLLQELGERMAGLQPFLRYLTFLAENYWMESLCWMLLALFLGRLAQRRSSANYGVLAALAVNFSVWVLLGHQDLTTFLVRPQLWLIPLGLIILVAEFVNRDRLGFWPSLSVRYAGLACIYVSSMFEMFMVGLGNSIVLPIALMLLAVGGMLLGILFRVRAFVFTGFLALLVAILSQIWHAAGQYPWIWWVCGIVLGVLILVLFAVFEKRRNDVLQLVDSIKRWQ